MERKAATSITIALAEAQARLPEIIANLGPDDEVLITDGQRSVARLVANAELNLAPRVPGNCKDMSSLLVEDDEHLDDFAE